jgi:hypothetical protein
MCCRLRIDNRELRRKGGGLFGADPLTGSVGIVTINMPRIGYLAKNKKDFFKKLKEMMVLAKESLVIKREVIEYTTEQGLFPYSKFYLSNIIFFIILYCFLFIFFFNFYYELVYESYIFKQSLIILEESF